MDAIEPHAISLLWFMAFATVCAVAFLVVAGMFPLRARPDSLKSGLATLLVVSNVVLLVVLLTGTVFYGCAELGRSTFVVVAGLVVLFAPGLFEAWPSPLRDGRTGLTVLVGIQALALAVLAKVGGSTWAAMS
jgi:hypothetical protein